ncbi:MAG: IS66 family insertion sequence element accessory protein TnpB [Hyphomonas sp.]|nr:IS66 family insertion sequence element accessory protein TnpB [Hyphomonas sp.]
MCGSFSRAIRSTPQRTGQPAVPGARCWQRPVQRRALCVPGEAADRVKIVWWDGSGVCLFAKRLEKSTFCWPRIGHVRVQLNHAQLMALLDGLDWKRVRPVAVKAPVFAG